MEGEKKKKKRKKRALVIASVSCYWTLMPQSKKGEGGKKRNSLNFSLYVTFLLWVNKNLHILGILPSRA